MSQLEQLMAALDEKNQSFAMAQDEYAQSSKKQRAYDTRRSRGLIPMIGEVIFDNIRKKQTAPGHQATLQAALDAASGVDTQQREIDALIAQQEQAEQQATQFETQGLYQQYGMGGPEAALRARGHDLPARQKPTSAMQNAEAMGLKPGTPQYNQYMRNAGGGVKVYTGGADYIPSTDPNAPPGAVEPRPGSGEEYKRNRDTASDAAAAARAEQTKNTRVGDFDQMRIFIQGAKSAVNEGKSAGWWALGSEVPESNALALQEALMPVMSGVALGEMTRLKSQSAVGATGFGALSEKELAIISNARGSLNQKQRPEDLIKNLETIDKHFKNFIDLLNGEVPDGYQSMELDGKMYIKGADGIWEEM